MYIVNADVVIISDSTNGQNPGYFRSAGSYRIASELRKFGYTCQVIDFFTTMTEEEQYSILEKVVGPNTKILGLSSTFFDYVSDIVRNSDRHIKNNVKSSDNKYTINFPYKVDKMKLYFDFVKTKSPNIKIVLGGYKAMYRDAPGVDVLVTGAGDAAIIKYMEYLNGKNPFFQCDVNETDPSQIIINGDSYNNTFDFSSSEIKYEQHDNILPNETLTIEVSRGCIFNCNFCSEPYRGKTKNDYLKNSNNLRDEFLRNYYEFGITSYQYSDETHNDNNDKLINLAKIVQSLPFEIEYRAYLRIDLMYRYPEQYSMLRDGGIKGAFFGIETLNHSAGKIIGKGLHPDKIINELHNFRKQLPHVSTSGGFIVGLPTETKESVTEWCDIIGDHSFPLHHISIIPLIISKLPNKLHKSDFEENSAEWYTWEGDNWHNGDFDSVWASNFVSDFSRKIGESGRQGLVTWVSYTPFMGMPAKEVYKKILAYTAGLKRNYVDMLLSNEPIRYR
jgi:hypothetical protein